MARHTQLLPVRMILDFYRVRPSRSRLEDEPLVKVQGWADIAADFTRKEMPLWFDAEIQFYKDGSFDIVSLSPTYGGGAIDNPHNKNVFVVYRVAIRRAVEDNAKRMLGVS